MSDTPDHGVPQPDAVEVRHTLAIDEVERALVAAGVPRSRRQVLRYCETGMLDAVKVPGPSGPQWFVAPASLPKAIGDLAQWQAQRAGRTAPHPAMTHRVEDREDSIGAAAVAGHGAPLPAVAAASISNEIGETRPDKAGFVSQLEKRIEEKDDVIVLLKGQLVAKDEQIKELSTRYRETHTLLGAMQRMLAPLLGQSDPFKAGTNPDSDHQSAPS